MASESTRTVLVIMGMRDNASRERVVEVLEAVDGVKDVDVNLLRGRATISHEPRCELGRLVGAVVQAGYGAALDESVARERRLAPRQQRQSGQEAGS